MKKIKGKLAAFNGGIYYYLEVPAHTIETLEEDHDIPTARYMISPYDEADLHPLKERIGQQAEAELDETPLTSPCKLMNGWVKKGTVIFSSSQVVRKPK